jgi:hypothetical protein
MSLGKRPADSSRQAGTKNSDVEKCFGPVRQHSMVDKAAVKPGRDGGRTLWIQQMASLVAIGHLMWCCS